MKIPTSLSEGISPRRVLINERLRTDQSCMIGVICYNRPRRIEGFLRDCSRTMPTLPVCLVGQGDLFDESRNLNIFAYVDYEKAIGISAARNIAAWISDKFGFKYTLHADDDIRMRDRDGALQMNPPLYEHLLFMLHLMDKNDHVAGIKFVQRHKFFRTICKITGTQTSLEVSQLMEKGYNPLDDWRRYIRRTVLLSNFFILNNSLFREIGPFLRNRKPIQDVDWCLRAQLRGLELLCNSGCYVEWPVIGEKLSSLGSTGYRERSEAAFVNLFARYSPLVSTPYSSKYTPLLSLYPALIKAGEVPKEPKLRLE